MQRMKRNVRAMIERREPYEALAAILTFALFVGGEWIAAALVGLFLVWVRHRVIQDDG